MFKELDLADGTIIEPALVPTPYTFAMAIRTRDYETDSQGIVNNANYLHYLEMTRHAFCHSRGFSFSQMTAMGLIAVMRRIEMDYIASLRGGELFVSCLWLQRSGPRFIFHQDLYRACDDAPVVRALATIVETQNGHLTKGDTLAQHLNI